MVIISTKWEPMFLLEWNFTFCYIFFSFLVGGWKILIELSLFRTLCWTFITISINEIWSLFFKHLFAFFYKFHTSQTKVATCVWLLWHRVRNKNILLRSSDVFKFRISEQRVSKLQYRIQLDCVSILKIVCITLRMRSSNRKTIKNKRNKTGNANGRIAGESIRMYSVHIANDSKFKTKSTTTKKQWFDFRIPNVHTFF